MIGVPLGKHLVVRHKPDPVWSWRDQARSKAGQLGPYAVRHWASKPEYRCSSGLYVLHLFGVEQAADGQSFSGDGDRLKQFIRCRKCDGCRMYRRALWCARSMTEAERWLAKEGHIWMLTVTHRHRLALGADEVFMQECRNGVKRFRERIRRSGVADFACRHFVVFERHRLRPGEEVGYPHMHALMFVPPSVQLDDFLEAFRWIGFIEAKRLWDEPKYASGYVTKYLSKCDEVRVSARIWASLRYGKPTDKDHDHNLSDKGGPEGSLERPAGDGSQPVETTPEPLASFLEVRSAAEVR